MCVLPERFSVDVCRLTLADAGDGMEDSNFVFTTANRAVMKLTQQVGGWVGRWSGPFVAVCNCLALLSSSVDKLVRSPVRTYIHTHIHTRTHVHYHYLPQEKNFGDYFAADVDFRTGDASDFTFAVRLLVLLFIC